jgi:DNA polymerase-3 subunit alpha
VEVIAFPEAYQRAAGLIEAGTMVLVRGKLERDDEAVRVIASDIAPIEAVRERLAREIAIRVRRPADRQLFERLGEIFSRHRGDRRVSFEIELPAESRRLCVRADVTSQIRVQPSPSLIAEVEQVVGAGAVTFR